MEEINIFTSGILLNTAEEIELLKYVPQSASLFDSDLFTDPAEWSWINDRQSKGFQSYENTLAMYYMKHGIFIEYEQTENEYLNFHNNFYIPTINKYIPYPYDRGIASEKVDRHFLNSVEFKNLVRFKRGKVSNLFRTVEETKGTENIVTVMEWIIVLSDIN